jgi:hypothetical protein
MTPEFIISRLRDYGYDRAHLAKLLDVEPSVITAMVRKHKGRVRRNEPPWPKPTNKSNGLISYAGAN